MEYVDAIELGKQVGVHPQTIRRLAADGKIPAVRIGGQWRFCIEDVVQRMKDEPQK
ncbi:MAG: helix-turn-helix domain-containing protein [Elusimicrobiales bacterium]